MEWMPDSQALESLVPLQAAREDHWDIGSL